MVFSGSRQGQRHSYTGHLILLACLFLECPGFEPVALKENAMGHSD